jgi:UDP-N-acetylglucosamine 2-epimerase (non-hydrolysing)
MAPLIKASQSHSDVAPIVCFTGQHKEMVEPVASYFGLKPDLDLEVMSPGQTLAALTAKLIERLDRAIVDTAPSCVVAQGDTTSTFAGALAAFYRRVPFVHVEAGLRTKSIWSPWPEEFNRRAASLITTLHAPPTEVAADALRSEGVPENAIKVTGNTVIDALLEAVSRERANDDVYVRKYPQLQDRELILTTSHRRENHGAGLDEILKALRQLALDRPKTVVVFPVHLHPQVRAQTHQVLGGIDNVLLLPPLDYPEFVWMMQRAKLIISDSGGVQEEAPSLQTPVLVTRDTTERPESLAAGATKLVGADAQAIVRESKRLLEDNDAYKAMQIAVNPYGDGRTAQRIVEWMLERIPA